MLRQDVKGYMHGIKWIVEILKEVNDEKMKINATIKTKPPFYGMLYLF